MLLDGGFGCFRWEIVMAGDLFEHPFRVAVAPKATDDAGPKDDNDSGKDDNHDDDEAETQEDKYENRFPQDVSVSDVTGKLLIEGNNTVIGRIKGIAKTKDGKLKLIVPYGGFLGFGGRLVAVPLEVVASIGTALVSVDMERPAYEVAPTWVRTDEILLGPTAPVRVAITRH
jgi:hypothetical protein